jgi:hypothetical protein
VRRVWQPSPDRLIEAARQELDAVLRLWHRCNGFCSAWPNPSAITSSGSVSRPALQYKWCQASETATPTHGKEFREDAEPIGIEELKRLNLKDLPEDVHIPVLDDHFPETTIWREGEQLVCEIQEHLYTKYWEHKFSAYAFAEAMERAVRRLTHEGHPFAEPSRDDEDVHIFVRWQLKLRSDVQADLIPDSIKSAFDLVWHRADLILENSDSVLILGKDSGAGLDRLKRIRTSCTN